jgi:hypothetical protein
MHKKEVRTNWGQTKNSWQKTTDAFSEETEKFKWSTKQAASFNNGKRCYW